jgi:hypothetical protein
MEHAVRVLNDHDRRTLQWLRGQVGDASIAAAVLRCGPSKPYVSRLCRCLGLTPPSSRQSRGGGPTATGEQSLARIRQILAASQPVTTRQ